MVKNLRRDGACRGIWVPLFLALALLIASAPLAFTQAPAQEPKKPPEQPRTGTLADGRVITKDDLDRILGEHQLWLESGGKQGKRADLSGAKLNHADLYSAILAFANLKGAELIDINLSWANLKEADLSGANLVWANLRGAILRNAELNEANLQVTDFSDADLMGANLSKTIV